MLIRHFLLDFRNISKCQQNLRFLSSFSKYIQGQNDPDKAKIREYFYFIDHNGMLFLDDSRMKNFTSCFKEKKFLNFFFKNIKLNKSGRYEEEFPFVSMCGIERNFIRCDDVPIVFTHIVQKSDKDFELVIAYSDLTYPFIPESLYMLPESLEPPEEDGNFAGRIYHLADSKLFNYGLIRSTIAQEIGDFFQFDDNKQPIAFKWKDKVYRLNNELASVIKR